ncbi:transposase IS4 family protein [Mycobacteroides abscessus subsp. abscessus]|uniref:IS1380 family transposase n=8 Tax=Mycobacteriaceae TaxID=1762 RepID=A0AAW5SMG6_MYCNV|nr:MULTISPECIES: IS1380 family transposase [Mycobacteriaceae]TXH16330.1 MAG: IS1380 family transposase [Mycobacterium sp.]AGM27518.1 transposase IS4 family protein [Mycobacteroides abscessus subsp. bolletii 50594]AGM27877.1 transposase IS4 family protein [Mycobacteroides abscessus subsp. bolletii 50594]AGM28836.1 transposase IS4 family protein [Mycobacteroides abscessus subsp. bolletii 50594]AGM29124.1 transposase IS4 family protein [Mycobacteroides abscessus subsp. bolletii 50594]
MKNIAAASPVKVSADGHGVVSHAGMGMLRELADRTGLSAQVTAALADTYRGPWVYAPGEVFADLAAAVADGADCIDAVGQLCGDREHVLGAKASTTTMWRLIDERIDAAHLPGVRAARAAARAAAWAVGAAPTTGGWLHIDIDATLVIDHSDNKAGAAPTWKKTFGLHPLLAFLDRPDIAGGEALAGLLRNGNAGSNTASDHIIVLHQALASLPAAWRPNPDDPDNPEAPKVLVRCDTAGSTHKFAAACRAAGAGFSFGYPVDTRVQDAVDTLNLGDCWYPAIDTDGGIRDGAWVAEATDLVNLASWPEGTRLILRKERPHPGAQLRFTDADGMRVTAFITDTPPGVVPGQVAGLELRHRQHARVEDRIRELKATGLRNLPCHSFWANAAWLEIVLAAADLVTWTRLIGFASDRALARVEITTFRYRVLHVAARITRGARQLRLRIDATWRWAAAIAAAWHRVRTAFG